MTIPPSAGSPQLSVPARPLRALTERELEMLRFAAAGTTNRQIAEALVLSEATVKSHFEHIRDKLGVPGRTAAVARALRENLID